MHVHLIDGTFELFRFHHAPGNKDPIRGAVRGVLRSLVSLIEQGGPDGLPVTHLGVATDTVIESFRNSLWRTYKTGVGIDPFLLGQFDALDTAVAALGITVWPMITHEADDALASAAKLAAEHPEVETVVIATPDKDLAQCVGGKVIQWDRMRNTIRDSAAVQAKFGVPPAAIPHWLALVGDSADGFPGVPGFGAKTAAKLLTRFGTIDNIPTSPDEWGDGIRGATKLAATLESERENAATFLTLAQLVVDVSVGNVESWRWNGPTANFADVCADINAPDLPERVAHLTDPH